MHAVFHMFLLSCQWPVASELFDEQLSCCSYNRQ